MSSSDKGLHNNNNFDNNSNNPENISADEIADFKYKFAIVNRPEAKLVGVSCKVKSSDLNQNNPENSPIHKTAIAYQKLMPSVPNRKNGLISYCIYRDYKAKWWGLGGMEFTYFIGQEVWFVPNKMPPELTSMTIPAGKYANFKAQGKMPEISEKLWKATLVMPEDKLGGTRTKFDFEEYDAHKMQNMNSASIQLNIGIE